MAIVSTSFGSEVYEPLSSPLGPGAVRFRSEWLDRAIVDSTAYGSGTLGGVGVFTFSNVMFVLHFLL